MSNTHSLTMPSQTVGSTGGVATGHLPVFPRKKTYKENMLVAGINFHIRLINIHVIELCAVMFAQMSVVAVLHLSINVIKVEFCMGDNNISSPYPRMYRNTS